MLRGKGSKAVKTGVSRGGDLNPAFFETVKRKKEGP